MEIPMAFRRAVERTPERTALIDLEDGSEYSYREVEERVNAVANTLLDRGLEPGDRVAICLQNRVEHALLVLATAVAGGVAVPFNFRGAAGDVRYHLEDAAPKVFAFGEAVRSAVGSQHEDLPCDEYLFVGDQPPAFATPFADLLDGSTAEPGIEVAPEDLSVILYTSGTTGQPKGIPLDHRAAVTRALDTSLAQGSYLQREVTLATMPMYHTIGLHSNFLARMLTSGTFIPMPDFDPEAYVRAIDAMDVTVLFTAPTVLTQALEAHAAKTVSFDSLRVLMYGGEKVGERRRERIEAAFDPERMVNVYGATEVYHPLELTHPEHSGRNGLFYRRRIVEFDGADPSAEVPVGTEGELVIDTDSPIVFDGYWEKPEETAEAIVDGWFFTGDAAYETDEGFTVITGRADDTIVSGGENIHPTEVEDALLAHPHVADVGVVGTPDEEWGEVVTTYVQPDGTVDADELDSWCVESEDLADFKRPREYTFVDEIPRNPSGKIMRYRLRDRD